MENINLPPEIFETVHCPVCGERDYTVIYPPRHDPSRVERVVETFRSSGDETLFDQLVQCRGCGFKFINPRLRRDIILKGYSEGSDSVFVSQNAAREKTFAKCLKIIERYQPGKGRILDVGTAGGTFLAVAKRQGWDVAGCEPNQWLCSWGREHYGLSITPGTISDMNLANHSFDVVTLWDVLEHMPNPREALIECRRVLKPGGLLVVNYPDIGSWIARLMGRKWVFLLSVHLSYFTVETMTRMLKDTGFSVLKRQPHFQTLELDYIFYRMEAYIPVLPGWCRKVFAALGLKTVLVPYWMGQTLVLARASEGTQ